MRQIEERKRRTSGPTEPGHDERRPIRKATLTPGAIRALQGSAGNQAVARMIQQRAPQATVQRFGGGDLPLAEAVGLRTADFRAQVGEAEFQTLAAWWRVRDLEPIAYHARPIQMLRWLARNFAGVGMDELAQMIRDLTPRLGVPGFVMLSADGARFLRRHLANAQLASTVLMTLADDVAHADAVMQFLQPYLANAAQLAAAQAELARLQYDVARAAPVVAFLAPYAANPVALPVARQELMTANDDVAVAQAEMNVLARYNFDRALRTQTETKAEAAKTAALGAATQKAASDKALAYQHADAAEKQIVGALVEPSPPSRKATKTAKRVYQDAIVANQNATAAAATARTNAEAKADADEQQALVTGAQQAEQTKQQVITGVEGFIATVTQSHDAPTAKYVIETAGFDVQAANALLPLFPTVADAREHAAWAVTQHGKALPRAVAHLQAAAQAGLRGADARTVVATLMPITISDAARTRMFTLFAHYAADWATVSAFVTGSYPNRPDDAATALEQAHAHHLALAELVPFGSAAHVFTSFVAQHPAFFIANAAWVRTVWPATYANLQDLCTLLVSLRALPQPTIELLVLEQRQHLIALGAHPAALAHVAAAAAISTLDALRANLPWYVHWFCTLGQGAAGVAQLVTTFPDVAERKRLSGGFTHPALRTRLITDKTELSAPRFAQVVRVVEVADTFHSPLGPLADALTAIRDTYEQHAGELYDLLEANKIGRVPEAITDAADRGAPKSFITWAVKKSAVVEPQFHFLGHANAYHEWLCTDGAANVSARTITLDTQTATTTSGTNNDILHVFYVDFTVTQPDPEPDLAVRGELHNHVHRISKRQTSLHFKNSGESGRELDLKGALAKACRKAVVDTPALNAIFPDGYELS